jgi:NADH-quinone oxidoreductase subunit G
LPDLDLFAILLNRPGGPARSGEILAEVAETVPSFGVARGGIVPALGVVLGPTQPADGAGAAARFVDSWYVPQGAARWR